MWKAKYVKYMLLLWWGVGPFCDRCVHCYSNYYVGYWYD